MTIDKIKAILPPSFLITNNSDNQKQLYVVQKHNELEIAKYVFDLDYDNQDFKLDEYQDKYIAKDYFDSEGNLQWNYYLIFLRSSLPASFKKDIEKDETFARKFVFTYQELEDYLNYEKADSIVEENIVEKWKVELEKNDLQEVFSNEPYTQAVPRYIENKSKKLTELNPIDVEPDKAQDFMLDGISNIKLTDEYRKFPEQRSFDFGKVNLICGPNGVGKTSLMEGIELVVTGNNARNENDLPNDGAIDAKYEVNLDELADSYSNNIPKFKARNYYWYKTSYNKQKSNTLHHSFNRYNFYNSDSAYHLSNNANSNLLTPYLTAIALGTEFGAVRDRMMGFRKRLGDELSNFNSNLEREQGLIKNAQEQKEVLKKISNPEKIFDKFLDEAKIIKWLKVLPSKISDNSIDFEKDYDTIKGLLNSIVHSKVAKESDAIDKLSNLEGLKKGLETKEREKETLREQLKIEIKQANELEQNLKLVDEALSYLDNPEAFKIETIDEEIKALEKRTLKVDVFLSEIAKLNISDLSSSSYSFIDFRENQEEFLKGKESELGRSQEQLKIVKDALDKVKSIIVDIKYYGKEYIEAKQDLSECPLCETPHTKSELEAKIQTKYDDKESSKDIETFNKNIGLLEKQILEVKNKLTRLKSYEDILGGFFPVDISSKKITELTILKEKEERKLALSKKELDELKTLSLDLRLKGYDVNQIIELKRNLALKYNDYSFTAENKFQFESLKKSEQKSFDDKKEKVGSVKNKIEEIDVIISELIKDKYDLERYEEQLDFEIKEFESYKNYFSDLHKYIDFEKDNFIIELRHSLENLYKTFESFKEQKVKFEELNLANKIIEESNEKIKKYQPKIARAESALQVLHKLITEDSEDVVLDDFFKKNESEISEIFTNIHAPQEFSRLSFSSGQILLHKKDSLTEVPISQISTGQRSALALSVFLALNKKLTNGPNLIIFDDPVTYTDDLNILSFLDYLRSIVINESRQVVFATASNKIAKLFEKKFAFLNTDFKKFELSRS